MTKLPMHGPIKTCPKYNKCFPRNELNASLKDGMAEKWDMRYNPCSWGGPTPKFLILGFSKGKTQDDAFNLLLKNYTSEDDAFFNSIAFKGMRKRLSTLLIDVGIKLLNNDITNHIKSGDNDFHFASLIRCSVSRKNKNGTHKTSGALVNKSFHEIPLILDNCFDTYLMNLPKSVQVIFLLGSSDIYVKNCKTLIKNKLGPISDETPVSYIAGGKIWVHLAHPSPANGHFSNWRSSNKAKIVADILKRNCIA